MPYIGNVTTSSNVNGSQINNGTITGDKLSLPFNYDSATLYLDDTNNRVGILTASPSSTLTVGTGGVVSIPLASAATPSLVFGTNTNTGIYSPGADQVAISTNGSGRLFVDSSGRVGVGTSAPAELLTVNGATPAALVRTSNAVGNAQIKFNADDTNYAGIGLENTALVMRCSNSSTPTERLRIDSSGRLGLGTSSPSELFHLSTTSASDATLIRLDGGSGLRQRFFPSSGTGKYNWQIAAQSNVDNGFEITPSTASGGSTFSTPAVVVKNDGKVGIGTSFPAVSTHIYGATNADQYWDAGGTVRGYAQANTSNAYFAFGTTTNHPVRFLTNATTAVTIDSSQRVGIGTTGPQAPLDVTGTGNTGVLADGAIRAYSANRTAYSTIAFNGIDASTNSVGLLFSFNQSEAARIDSSKRLLVGTSSTLAGATDSLLQIRGNSSGTQFAGKVALATDVAAGSITSGTDLGAIYFGNVANGIGGLIECKGDAQWGTNDYPGRLTFSTTADGSASPTERMRISNNGTVAINSSNSNYFLEVTGTSVLGGLRVQAPGSGGYYPVLFRDSDATSGSQQLVRIDRGGSQVGYIATTNTSTSYNTSSDYRLKENVKPITEAAARILRLKPSRFNFIVNPDHTVDGFLAHEAQAVVPECVTGTKDEVDADGNPVMQGIDQSKLVPLLTAALQEAIGEIESLKARVVALESA